MSLKDDQTSQFNEHHHAFISASFYKRLAAETTIDGTSVFVLATQRYGEQRGNRMAQRALRDGRARDFATYCAYGEWSYTEDYYAQGKHIETLSTSPDYHYLVHTCPWHDQYKEMDLIEGAILYCREIDLAIARGFNPHLVFEVNEIMHNGRYCDFVLKGAELEAKGYKVDASTAKLPFEYHCGHVYTTFTRICISILGAKGKNIADAVTQDFTESYGATMTEKLTSYLKLDFEILPPETMA